MDYQKAWLKLKESLEYNSKNGHNSMTSMSEGTWTEIISGNIVEQMNRLETEMMNEAGLDIEDDSNKVEKPVFLVKFNAPYGDTVAVMVTAKESLGSVGRAISRFLSVSYPHITNNIENFIRIGSELVEKGEKKVVALSGEQYDKMIESYIDLHIGIGIGSSKTTWKKVDL